jgi:Putative peptidoglycan binding domain
VSETVSRAGEAGQQAEVLAAAGAAGAAGARRPRGRGRWVALGIVVVAAGVVPAWQAGAFAPAASSPGAGSGAVATAPVVRTTLTTTVQVGGSIGHAGSYSVTAVPPGSSAQGIAGQQAVIADEQIIAADQQALSGDEQAQSDATAAGDQTVAADRANVSTAQSALATDQARQAYDCANTSSALTGPETAACAADQQQVRTDQGALTTARQKLAADQQTTRTATDQAGAAVAAGQVKLRGDQVKLGSDQAALAALQATAASPGTTYTWLPQPGQVIGQGQRVYAVNGQPVPLLYGAIAAYRPFYPGMPDGADVGELTRDLITMGYGAGLTRSGHYSAATATAVARWQQALGLPPTGKILLGQVVFEPGPIRVTTVTPAAGAPVPGSGGTVLTATGTTPLVTVNLDVTQEYLIKPGDAVSVVLPDGTTTVAGQVDTVGTVATCAGGGSAAGASPCSSAGGNGGGNNPSATVTVTITLGSIPSQARLDQAPVNVNITSQRAAGVLAVPVNALVALAGGGYAVQVVTGSTSHLVPVTTGLYSNTMVQIDGPGITAGTLVEVPSS